MRWTDGTHYWLVHRPPAGGDQLVEVVGTRDAAGQPVVRVRLGHELRHHHHPAATIVVSVNGCRRSTTAARPATRRRPGGLRLGAAGTASACTWDNFAVTSLAGERLWPQQDANFNVTALVNSSGTVVERYTETPYGTVTVYDGSWSVRTGGSAYSWVYQHQGLRYDGVSATYQNRARVYHPSLSRFLQNDPTGFGAGDTNLYRAEGDAQQAGLIRAVLLARMILICCRMTLLESPVEHLLMECWSQSNGVEI